MTFDPVAVVEACYRPAPDDGAWLRGLLEALSPVDRGPGLVARIKDAGAGGSFRTLAAASWPAAPAGWVERMDAIQEAVPRAALVQLYWPCPPLQRARLVARRAGPWAEAQLSAALAPLGFEDSYGLLGGGPEGRLLDVGIGLDGRRALPPRIHHQLSQLSAHLTSALRLRASLGRAGAAVEDPETDAALRPDGQVTHARPEAASPELRRGLAAVVRRVERARGSLRRASPEEALAMWRGLVNGRWSLLDHVEADGRRLILARRNEPRLPDPRALTRREQGVLAFAALGHPNKYVAYLLGLSPATVAGHLASACRKLGVPDRREALAILWPGLLPGPGAERGVDPPAR